MNGMSFEAHCEKMKESAPLYQFDRLSLMQGFPYILTALKCDLLEGICELTSTFGFPQFGQYSHGTLLLESKQAVHDKWLYQTISSHSPHLEVHGQMGLLGISAQYILKLIIDILVNLSNAQPREKEDKTHLH